MISGVPSVSSVHVELDGRLSSTAGRTDVTTKCTRRSSSALIHNTLRSGTEKAMDSGVRLVRNCRMVRHPSTGWNLLMAGVDRLDGGTGTPVVSQRSESGQGILGAKEGRGMWLWSAVVVGHYGEAHYGEALAHCKGFLLK